MDVHSVQQRGSRQAAAAAEPFLQPALESTADTAGDDCHLVVVRHLKALRSSIDVIAVINVRRSTHDVRSRPKAASQPLPCCTVVCMWVLLLPHHLQWHF